jgi:hypothetical protein
MSNNQSAFAKLNAINVRDKVERKGNQDYLSWAYAWSILKHEYPEAQRTVYESPFTGMNYFTDGNTAYVKVGVTIGELEHIDYLPIMNYNNKAISVESVTSFDVNKTIQRSTVKAIAMHGLGIQLWTGEDIPELTTSAPARPMMVDKTELVIGDGNWEKVKNYAVSNKELGGATIIKNLEKKYKLSADIKTELKSLLK